VDGRFAYVTSLTATSIYIYDVLRPDRRQGILSTTVVGDFPRKSVRGAVPVRRAWRIPRTASGSYDVADPAAVTLLGTASAGAGEPISGHGPRPHRVRDELLRDIPQLFDVSDKTLPFPSYVGTTNRAGKVVVSGRLAYVVCPQSTDPYHRRAQDLRRRRRVRAGTEVGRGSRRTTGRHPRQSERGHDEHPARV